MTAPARAPDAPEDSSALEVALRARGRDGWSLDARLRLRAHGFVVTAVVGPSGVGKTTLLRTIAGLTRAPHARVRLGDQVWQDARTWVPPHRRPVGYVAQDLALFPHLDVGRNVGFGLFTWSRRARDARVDELLAVLDIERLRTAYPAELSGGQRQRVALARAVARPVRLLLLDEPLHALDVPTRDEVRGQLRGWLRRLAVPVVLVTHDRLEAATQSDDVAVLMDGVVAQHGPTTEVFARPASEQVARLLGIETRWGGRVVAITHGLAAVACAGVHVQAPALDCVVPGREVLVCFRAEDVTLARVTGERPPAELQQGSARNVWSGRVGARLAQGALVRLEVRLDPSPEAHAGPTAPTVVALLTRASVEELELHVGTAVMVHVKAAAVHVIVRS